MPSNQSPGQTFDRPLIQAQNVSREYRLGEAVISAVNDVSLEIRAGEFLALLGSSGSGKSTFLNLLGPDSIALLREPYTFADATWRRLTRRSLRATAATPWAWCSNPSTCSRA